jgi:hypothetical protein
MLSRFGSHLWTNDILEFKPYLAVLLETAAGAVTLFFVAGHTSSVRATGGTAKIPSAGHLLAQLKPAEPPVPSLVAPTYGDKLLKARQHGGPGSGECAPVCRIGGTKISH